MYLSLKETLSDSSDSFICVAVEYEVKLQNGTVVDKSPEEGVQYKLKDGELFELKW